MNKQKLITSLLIAATIMLLNVHCVFGQEWEQVNVPDSVLSVGHIYCKGEKIYIATNFGIYYSNDNCNNWEYLGLEGYSVYAILLTEDNVLFSGGGSNVFKYIGNQQWELLHTNGGGGNVVCFHQSANGDIYESSWGGIYRSQDGGQTWERVLEASYVEIVNDIDENSEGILFAGSTSYINDPGGFYRSDDNGDTWNLIGLNYHFISSIEINTFDTIFVGTNGHYYNPGGKIFKSLDKMGNSWQVVYDKNYIESMCINEFNSIVICCPSFRNSMGGIFLTYDSGENWEDITPSFTGRYFEEVLFDNSNLIYAISYFEYGDLFRTINPITSENNIEFQNSELLIYPNPARGQITIKLLNSYNQYIGEIIDINGVSVQEFKFANTDNMRQVQINNLEEGVYFIVLKNNYQQYFSKFIKH